MMGWQHFFLVAGAHFLALLSPGPDFFLVLRSALRQGRRQANAVCVGIALANGVYIALAVTGVAGPDGGTETKPVGLVYIALAGPKGNIALKHTYLFDRESNRNHAALTALNMLRLELLK